MLVEIEIDNVPDGWKPVRYDYIREGEYRIVYGDKFEAVRWCHTTTSNHPAIILEPDHSSEEYRLQVYHLWLRGAEIEYRHNYDGEVGDWLPSTTPCWRWPSTDYRVVKGGGNA